MKASSTDDNVDYRLLGLLSSVVICARCLRDGRVRHVPQIFSPRHTPKALCSDCTRPRGGKIRQNIARLAGRR